MKDLLVCITALAVLAGCRLGGGFDSEGRLRGSMEGTVAEVKATGEPAIKPVPEAEQVGLIYYITPAG
jgi:hypothetical protein